MSHSTGQNACVALGMMNEPPRLLSKLLLIAEPPLSLSLALIFLLCLCCALLKAPNSSSIFCWMPWRNTKAKANQKLLFWTSVVTKPCQCGRSLGLISHHAWTRVLEFVCVCVCAIQIGEYASLFEKRCTVCVCVCMCVFVHVCMCMCIFMYIY